SGEIEIDGSAMKSTSYSPDLEYQYIRMETKFNPGNLSVDMMNPNATRFNAEMAIGIKNYIDNLQKNVETMFAQFSNKTNEIKEEYAENQEIEDYKKELYKENRDGYLIAFQGLQKELGYAFGQEMLGSMTYYEKGSQYNFGESGSSHIPKMATKGSVPKNGKPEYESLPTIDTTFVGERELKGTVNIKGIPVEMNYGMQHLAFTEEFDLSKLSYNFNLKGLGTSFAEQQLSVVNQKYSQYLQGVQADLEKQAKKNDEERDKKGFLFNVLSGMSGGQKPHEAVRSEVQSRITGAVAEATGLPAGFVGALVGGSNMKQAMKAYEKSVTTEAISQATGIPAWYLNQKISEKEANHEMAKSFSYNAGRSLVTMVTGVVQVVARAGEAFLDYTPSGLLMKAVAPSLTDQARKTADNVDKQAGKFADHIGKEAYKNRETIDTVVTVAAVVGAAFSFGTSMAALAAYKIAEGATEGGVYGALAGAVSTVGTAASIYTGGMIGFDCSYSYADGFGASVGGGMKLMEGLAVGATLSYNEQTGFGGSVGLQAGTNALSFNAGLSYSEQGGISGSAGLGRGLGKNGATGSYSASLNLGVSYSRQDGFGMNAGLSSNNNHVLPGMGATISRSEYSGWGADVSTDQYGKVEGGGGRPSFGGVSGGLAWSERDGFTASFNVAGTNALSYNSQTGLSSNGDFISQYSMNNILAQGVADTDEEKAYKAAKAEADSRAAQNRNNQESGAAAASGIAVELENRRRDEDGAENEGRSNNNGKGTNGEPLIQYGKGSYDNNYDRRPDVVGSQEAINRAQIETDPTKFNQHHRGELAERFTDTIRDLRQKAEASLTSADRSQISALNDEIKRNTDALNGKGSSSLNKTPEQMRLEIATAQSRINEIKYNKPGILPTSDPSGRNYQSVINMLGDNKISTNQLGASTAGAICYIQTHAAQMGHDTVDFWKQQISNNQVGVTNQQYHGMQSLALGAGSGWVPEGNKYVSHNTTDGRRGVIPVLSADVNALNNSKANTAIAWIDNNNDGAANHYIRIVRDTDGFWYNYDHNRSGQAINRPEKVNFNNVYGIEYNPLSSD
ncbi:hypothetical protein, partial [Leptospira borgpetersenii]|uniref:hypothetical protein n=1 Tax=Leptospira borgpetersenii TaxID=174 RepID=UPI000772D897